jgi:S-layer homology domain
MTDFNQDDRITPPVAVTPDPTPDNTRRKKLSSDELIALFLAFTGIGSILFWTLGQKTSPINLGSLTSGTPSFTQNGNPTAIATPSVDGVIFNGTAKPTSSTAMTTTPDAGTERRNQWTPAPTTPPPATETASSNAGNPSAGSAAQSGDVVKPIPSPTASAKGSLEKPVAAKQFSDVPNDFWAKDAIAALSSRGMITGYADNTFNPNKAINRAEFAIIVQKAFDKPKTKDVMKFTDIKEGFPAAAAIDAATQTGFMNGYPGGLFKPEQAIPRLEMLSAIATGMSLKPQGDPTQTLSRYSDAKDLPNWAVPKVSSAIEAGIKIPDGTLLEPTKTATRAEAAMFIYQALINDGKIKP